MSKKIRTFTHFTWSDGHEGIYDEPVTKAHAMKQRRGLYRAMMGMSMPKNTTIVIADTVVPAIGVPPIQLSKNPTPAQRRAFLLAYDKAGSQSKQDRMHEDKFKNAK